VPAGNPNLTLTLPNLPALTALARAGAVGRAWELFGQAGYLERTTDPAALAVKGRLLKGRGRLASGAEQRALFADAAGAYASAHTLDPAPYLAINAASLNLLAGDAARAAEGAREVLALLDAPDTPADTPYFLAATRAEALLILGERAQAEAAMEVAAAHDPDGWANRAATIAQLHEIARAQASDAGWIDRFAPPASLHFAGHMGLASGGASEAALAKDLDALFARHRFGFAWGALAAGADVVIAEQLLARGIELHVVLPCPPDQFEAQSVAPAGEGWTGRYRALLEQAASVRCAADSATSVHDPLATLHAGELAIGGALNNALTLASSAAQLIVTDEAGGGINTARQAALWRASSGPQHCLTVPRDAQVEALFPPEQPDPARVLAVHLAVGLDALAGDDALPSAAISALTAPVTEVLGALPTGSVRAAPGRWEASVEDLELALAVASRLAALGTVAVGAHLAIGPVLRDAPSGSMVPFGPAPALARHLMALAPVGVTLLSDALAVTLAARGSAGHRSELYHPGEDEAGGAVHTLVF